MKWQYSVCIPVGDDSQTIYSIAPHEAFKALFLPHPNKTGPHALILSICAGGLHLSTEGSKWDVQESHGRYNPNRSSLYDLEALQRADYGAGRGPGNASRNEVGCDLRAQKWLFLVGRAHLGLR